MSKRQFEEERTDSRRVIRAIGCTQSETDVTLTGGTQLAAAAALALADRAGISNTALQGRIEPVYDRVTSEVFR